MSIRTERTARRGQELEPRSVLLRALGIVVAVGLVASSALMADVEIDHDPVKKAKSGHRVELEAQLTDQEHGIREARAYFKSGHDTRYWFAPMRASGEKYVGILPAPALGAETVEYRIYAVSGADDFVKTQLYTIEIKDDEDALARLEAKEPTDVEIDLDQIEQARDLARRGGEADPSSRVEVRNDVPDSESPSELTGFDDYIVLAEAAPAAGGAGLRAAHEVKAAKGFSTAKWLGGAAAVGGLAVAADSASDDDDDPESASSCSSAFTYRGGGAPEQVDVDLGGPDGRFVFVYEAIEQGTRMVVSHEGRVLFDTGCVGTPGPRQRAISYSGSSSRITVDVTPNCGGGGDTEAVWSFTSTC